ncbi:nitroreductase [Streptantibioticus rubrisoli]|uniref:Putative NAD(P)H nitroreductase n=1 Tax=Streptantibioticus rubrisoli TaxID=1387313 RepID=A0ABT1PD63_9ACTN|nr:nitroreductase [Streptantibioticus rubrisoli]MCQ4043313.1 nitroreductase [Streptantibioticus rubrisoli]
MTAILTRRSEQVLREPAPGDAEFTYLLQGASTAPDHGRLRPWRWVLLRGEDRDTLGTCLAAEAAAQADDIPGETLREKCRRAPLVAALVFTPCPEHKVPEWEQLAATSCMVHALMLLLHARNYGSIWRTGRLSSSPAARRLLGLADPERLLGSLDIGTPEATALHSRRPLGDVAHHVTRFSAIRSRVADPV